MKRMTLAVALEQPNSDELIEFTVQADNRDMVRWDLVRARLGWPKTSDAPILWATVVAWAALTRSKEIDEKVEAFIDRAVSVRFVKEDGSEVTPEDAAAGDDGTTAVDPSRPEVASGY